MNVLFDLDGTLTDPFEGLTRSIAHALVALGRPSPPLESLRWCIGPPLRDCFAKLLGSDDIRLIEHAVAVFRERFSSVGLFENRVYAGIPEALVCLEQAGHALSVATSKPTVYAERILAHFGLRQRFSGVYGSELDGTRSDKSLLISHVLSCESIRSTETFMVGDRKHDMIGAAANGVAGIGVLWGYGTRQELEASGASVCVERPSELASAVGGESEPIDADLRSQWKREERHPFQGWDFSHLEGRMSHDPEPWCYPETAARLMRQSDSVLDLDTGGGERLLAMKESWPARVVATESYGPNVEIARRRLEPAGARVVELAHGPGCALPFADCSFALVLNRHGSLHVAEVSRVLAPGGTLLTEQVHDLWAHDLLAAFGAAVQHTGSTPERYAGELRRAGMTIGELQDWRGRLQFTDVGAIVYYLKAIPWLLPGFSVDTHYDHLVRLQKRVDAEGPLVFEAREYLIRATKSR